MLVGRLTHPQGEGPFPAVVLLHGCAGIEFEDPSPANTFLAWGFVTLAIDSFGPRGLANVCHGNNWLRASPMVRARDAHAGKDFLMTLPYVDADRVAVVGWSHGGMTVLAAVANWAMHEPLRPRPFKAAIAFYPFCKLKLPRVDAPLLVLIGDADDWTPVRYCRQMELTGETPHEYQLIVYPGASHAFDSPETWEYLGHKGWHDPEATADAYKRSREFLAKHLD